MTILNPVGTGERHRSRLPAFARTGLWLTLYTLAALLGRAVVVGPDRVGLVWPAAGVALVWLASSDRRLLPVDVLLMSAATMWALAVTEGGVTRTVLSLSVVVQSLLAVWFLRRLVPGIWGTGGRVQLSRLDQLGRVLVAVIGAVLVTSVLRFLVGSLVDANESFEMLTARFGRQVSAMTTIGVAGLLIGGWLAERRDRGRPLLEPVSRGALAHLLGIEAVAALIFLGFRQTPEIPSTYILSLTVVWAALRFNPVVTALHSLVVGVTTVLLTIDGFGPIADVGDPTTRALMAQLFVVALMVTGMTIALIRGQLTESVTRLTRSEAALALRADELDLVMSHLDSAVAIIDEGGRVLHTNPALAEVFGFPPDQSIDRLSVESPVAGRTYHPDGRAVTKAELPLQRALGGESIDAEEFRHVDGDGVSRWLQMSAFPLPHTPGAPRRAMLVIRDVTTLTTHRESLISFAGTVAHDLNNPLNVIDGWAELLEEDFAASDSPLASRSTPMVQHIRASAAQARGLIRDLLAHTIARDQALECELISLSVLVEHLAATRDQPGTGGQVVVGEVVDVWADRVLLSQVLDNLIGNAFKYVEPGTVPRVVIEASQVDDGWARVTVRDNGIGIPAVQRERIFDSFHRAPTVGYQGTGLGLAICKRVVRRHGGSISVDANPDGVGSCFEMTLPMTPQALRGATEKPGHLRSTAT